MSLAIHIDDDRTAFAPGETLAGTAAWQLPERPEQLRLNLFWYTQGKGSRDVEVVHSLELDATQPTGEAPFELALPAAPYSFSGRLISVCWALELVADPSGEVERVEIVMGPQLEEIVLGGADQ